MSSLSVIEHIGLGRYGDLIDSLGNILISDVIDTTEELAVPSDEDYNQVLQGKPVFITDSLENKTDN